MSNAAEKEAVISHLRNKGAQNANEFSLLTL